VVRSGLVTPTTFAREMMGKGRILDENDSQTNLRLRMSTCQISILNSEPIAKAKMRPGLNRREEGELRAMNA